MDRAPLLLLLLLGLARVDRQQGGQMSVSAGASLVAYTVPSHGVYPAHTLAASGQLLTSSTLHWVDVALVQSGRVAADSVVTVADSAVCRSQSGHRLEPGRTDLSGDCIVMGVKHKHYQVLADMHAMARISWDKWSMFKSPALGTVAFTDETFVGLMSRSSSGSDQVIAELDYSRGLNGELVLQLAEDAVTSATAGWALVETEPIKYSLQEVKFGHEKLVSSELLDLGTIRLERGSEGEDQVDWLEVSGQLRYNWTGYEHWGSVGGAVRGLPTTVQYPATATAAVTTTTAAEVTTAHFKWGLHSSPRRQQVVEAAARLQRGTGLNITASARRSRVDTSYTATLHAVYRDGSLRVHTVSAVRSRDLVTNITLLPGAARFLDTGLPAPTTTTTTSTTTTTTTAASPSTRPPHAHMFQAPSPTPTLFPPPPSPVTRSNPLKQFYPDTEEGDIDGEDDRGAEVDIIKVDILPLSHSSRLYSHADSLLLLLSLAIGNSVRTL